MDYKEITREVYDRSASFYQDKTKDYLKNYIIKDAELFLDNLSGNNVLDVGCGPGRDMAFFRDAGLNAYGIDISSSMCRLSKNKGLNVVLGDLENLPFAEKCFDGIWAYTSLLHMPKENFVVVLNNIAKSFNDKGIFYIGMKEGNFEGWKDGKNAVEGKRFYSLYMDDELRRLLNRRFTILHNSSVKSREENYLNYLCKKN